MDIHIPDRVVLTSENILKGPECEFELVGGLGKFIWNACDKYADNIYQINSDTDESETYSSFKSRSRTVAINLRKFGLRKGDVIITCTPNNLDSSLPATACLFLGAISSAFDPSLSARDCSHLTSLVLPKIIFTCADSIKLIEETLLGVKNCKPVIVVFGNVDGYKSFEDFLVESGEDFEPEFLEPEDPTFLIFSSGTTGLPKAICLSQKSSYIGGIGYNLVTNNTKVMMHFTSFYWISALMIYVAQFETGGTRILINKFDTETTLFRLAKYKVESTFLASAYGYKILNSKGIDSLDLSTLKMIIFGGSPMSVDLMLKLRTALPETFSNIGYGMTETSGFISSFSSNEKEMADKYPNSCGYPVTGIQIKIVDPETEQICGVNKPGEIRLKTDSLMVGYYNQDSSTALDSDGFLKTGDIGHFDENCCIYVSDRIKDMFKYQCWHIVPASIECVIMEHPEVQEAVIFGIPHEEDEHLPAAAVKLKAGSKIKGEDIEKFVAAKVLDRQRLRGGVFIVEDIPKTPTQKVLRRKVQQMILQRLENSNKV